MTGDSGPGGAFDAEGYQRSLDEFRETLRDMEIVGFPKRVTELPELDRLIRKYPIEARAILEEVEQQ